MAKLNRLKNFGDLKPCYLYISKSSSILNDTIEELKKFLKGKINFEVDFKIFYGGEDIDEYELVNFYKTPSFFSEKKVAVIKNFEKLPSNIIQQVKSLLSEINVQNFTTTLVITTTKAKIDKEIITIIKKTGSVENLEMPIAGNLKKWLDEKCELDGIKFTSRAATKLIENVNFDLDLLKTEYEKLYTFIIGEKDKTVNEEAVDKLTNRIYDMKIFDIVDFIGKRDKNNALKALKSVSSEKQNLIGLITLIHRMFKAILIMKSKCFDPEKEARDYLKSYIGHSPYFLGRIISDYKRYSRNYNSEEIIKIFDVLNRYDFLLRTSEVNENFVVTRLITEIVGVNK